MAAASSLLAKLARRTTVVGARDMRRSPEMDGCSGVAREFLSYSNLKFRSALSWRSRQVARVVIRCFGDDDAIYLTKDRAISKELIISGDN